MSVQKHTSSVTLGRGTDGLVADITKWTLVAVLRSIGNTTGLLAHYIE